MLPRYNDSKLEGSPDAAVPHSHEVHLQTNSGMIWQTPEGDRYRMETRSGPLIANDGKTLAGRRAAGAIPAGRIVLCTLAYWLAAAACIGLSVPTGNNSPVWIPTGIALAAVLRYGRPMLAAVAIGAFTVNLYLLAASPGLGVAAVAAALVIGTGNTLAAAAGAWLVSRGARAVRHDSALVVYGYVLVVGLAAMIGAAPGACALAAAGQLPWSGVGPVITLWWLGNVMALLLVTTLNIG